MKILKVIYIQLFICLLIFISLTLLRLFDTENFNEFSKLYSKYAHFDTNVSLVLEGK